MKKQKVTTTVHFIFDQSGSMGSILTPTIKGFNEYVKGLQSSKEKFKMTLTLFNDQGSVTPFTNLPIKQVEPLTEKTYIPSGGTPLYDAVVDSVEKLHEQIENSKEPVIVAIMTDGEENASQRHTEKCLKDLVEKLQNKGNWTFLYMGANQDAWMNASRMGIYQGNAMNWQASAEGADTMFKSMAVSSANYASLNNQRSAGNYTVKDFFKPEEQK